MHVGECAACSRELAEVSRLRERLLRLPPPAADPYFPGRVMALLPGRPAAAQRLLRAAAWAALFIAVFLGGFLLKTSAGATDADGRHPAATFSSVLLEPQAFGLPAGHDDSLDLFNGGGHEQE
jgi:anti-sigma factor RsiW